MSFKAYLLPHEGEPEPLDRDQITEARQSGSLLWLDFGGPTKEDIEFLKQVFGFHETALKACFNPRVRLPKIENFGEYLFIILHGVDYQNTNVVDTADLALFLGDTYVVTSHKGPIHAIDYVQDLVENKPETMKRSAAFLAHALMDSVVDNFVPVVTQMGEVADVFEQEVIQNPSQSLLRDILVLKRSVRSLRRVMVPHRDLFSRLGRSNDYELIGKEAEAHYRDIYDHTWRIEELIQDLQDSVDNALNTYLSSIAIRQNETMKILTTVATILLPPTLLASIYGMNFQNMPGIDNTWALITIMSVMGAYTAAALLWLFGRRLLRQHPRIVLDSQEVKPMRQGGSGVPSPSPGANES